MDVHSRRRERDRVAQAAARRKAREAGEPMGHALDGLVVEGLSLALAGRAADDPVRQAVMRGISRAFRARQIGASAATARRLQARLAIGISLELALEERRIDAIEA